MNLYEIFQHGSSIQGGSTERMARELAMMQMQREQQENARAERLTAAAHRRMQEHAMSDPALMRLRQSLEAPVEPFSPERPGSYAPGAADDVGTLRGAFGAGGGSPAPSYRTDPNAHVDVQLGDLELSPSSEGAFSAPRVAADTAQSGMNPADEAAFDRDYEEAERRGTNRPPNRKPLPAKPRRMEGGIDPTKGRALPQSGGRPDLSPEGAEMYAKLAPSLVSRRNAEEASRRGMEVEQMRGDSKERTAQLKSATDLVRQQMKAQADAERFRQKRLGAKGKDEALKWADQERDARLQAMNHAAGVVSRYKAAMADDPKDPEYQKALQALDEAARAYGESERDFNALRSQRGMDPKGKKAAGKAVTYTLDDSGNLIPAQ